MELGFYNDIDRVTGFVYKVKQPTLLFIPGWLTAMVDFVEDSTHKLYLVAAVGWERIPPSSLDPGSRDKCPWPRYTSSRLGSSG